MAVLLRWLSLTLIRIFFRRIEVSGRELLPAEGPVIFVSNHPNGLIDPLVLHVAVGGPLPFLAKSTFFQNPLGRLAMRAFHALPVYRQKDGADTSKNEETLGRCRRVLQEGGRLALYPEGVSHSEPSLRPMKTGAARIALQAEAEKDFALGLRLVPVGVFYENKQRFRSRVTVQVGAPLALADQKDAFRDNEREAVEALTRRIHGALSEVVLEAETEEIREGLVAVAAWTDVEASKNIARREERARKLARAFQQLSESAPEELERLVRQARELARLLKITRLQSPHAVQPARLLPAFVRFGLGQLLLAPFALVGVLLGWLPYRAVGLLVKRVTETDIVSTAKLVGGLVLIGAYWLLEVVLAGIFFGPWAALGVLVLAPLGGLAALRFEERIEVRQDLVRGALLRLSRRDLARVIEARRVELAAGVERALG